MANSKRKCGFCKERQPAETMFIRGTQAFCNKDHYIEYQVGNKDKLVKKGRQIKRKEHAEAKERVKTRAEWLRDAQTWFNRYIRLRDKDEPCISCDKPNNGTHQRHASHYRSVGACSYLRFHEMNVWASCSVCNNHLSGNLAEYRIRLTKKIGIDKVEWLESQPKTYKHTIDEIKEIIAKYKAKCKEIE